VKVLKFGGSSVGYKEGIVTLKKIVESQTDDVIVVVSALCGVTDGLILMAKTAAPETVSMRQSLRPCSNGMNS